MYRDELKEDIKGVKVELMEDIRGAETRLDKRFDKVDDRLDKMNNNFKWLIGIILVGFTIIAGLIKF